MNKINKIVKRVICLTMVLGLVLTGRPLLNGGSTNTVAKAASVRKCYLIGNSNINTYADKSLKIKKGSVFVTDEITVVEVTSRWTYIRYPIRNGVKYAYIPTSAILLSTGGTTYTNKVGTITTRKRPNGPNYGQTTSGDKVMYLGQTNGWTQIKYNVPGGYKYAFITNEEFNRIKGVTSNNNNSSGISNGTYTIVSALNNNYVVDIANGSKSSQANVQLYTNNGTNAQKFEVKKNSDGYYTIKNVGSGKVLDCAGAGTANGTNIWQYDNNSSAAQRWKIRNVGNGYYSLECKCNGKMLDVANAAVANGTNIQIYSWNGSNAQKWKLVPVTATNTTTSSNSIAQKMVNYELSQIGVGDYKGNNNVIYNTWYYGRQVSGSGYAWCMAFQAYTCKVITGSNNAIPKTASCMSAVNTFKSRGQFQYSKYYGGNYTPKAGDLVFYTNGSKYTSCHVGMVTTSPVNGYLQTVEGNILCSDGNWKVVKFTKNTKRTINSSYVLGYATPAY